MIIPPSNNLLRKNTKYKVVGVNYNRTIPFKGNPPYETSLLGISPYEYIEIIITNFPYHGNEAEVEIQKFHQNNPTKLKTFFTGIISLPDLKKILGFD